MKDLKEIKTIYNGEKENNEYDIDYITKMYGNCPIDSMIGVQNILQNKDYFAESLDLHALKNLYKNKTAMLVAGGWSIDENMNEIKRLSNHLTVVSCDTGLKILMENGISPEFVTCLERIKEVANLIKGFSFEKDKKPLTVISPLIHQDVMQALIKGNYRFAFCKFKNNKVFDLVPNYQEILCGNSSATMALALCDFLGFEKIILFGQDLVLNDEKNVSHSKFSVYGKSQNNSFKNLYEADCLDGEKRFTNDVWNVFSKDIDRIYAEGENIKLILNANKKALFNKSYSYYNPKDITITDCQKIDYKLEKFKFKFDNMFYFKILFELEYFQKIINLKTEKNEEFDSEFVEKWNQYIDNNQWLKSILQSLAISIYLIYDNHQIYLNKLFLMISNILRVVSSLFIKTMPGVQNFEGFVLCSDIKQNDINQSVDNDEFKNP
ncbi:MAG: 6-hydroxymethylpterin diphosphokinase MptE-like protein [Patescibacteria group bacterium]